MTKEALLDKKKLLEDFKEFKKPRDLAYKHKCSQQNILKHRDNFIKLGDLPEDYKAQAIQAWGGKPRKARAILKEPKRPIKPVEDGQVDLDKAIRDWSIILEASKRVEAIEGENWTLRNQLGATKEKLAEAEKDLEAYKETERQFKLAQTRGGKIHGD